ncbi:hypothetical protein [Pseudomonas aeruginosa]|uniref:hypothetical protein n=1 Tax=Pseudomonas aeruginosa TaxID=287 RepID=UPI000F88771C|nr:hypothetical protein [Pseudomonas aeruginosa]RSZ54063.1 hypothetical protein EJU38_05500 [Pseudomonas aeruginosa]WOT60873.1 hypothetical protein R5018_25100 [Pseudomonas aeruginosa]WOT74319.1 hypothetical protein R5026_27855 [Pseudomonas aeruginosa]WOT85440.1 hypothetical protein R5020_18815 [Pseudomonas aeruginosa]WOT98395.1 hypothetical protein R5015_18750 [Pseudomonas aeruginosa]
MSQVLDLRFDTLPTGYTPDSSRQVELGGGPPGGLPAGTIGVWGIRPPLLPLGLTLKRTLLPDPHVALDLDFSTVDRGYIIPPSSNVPLLFFKPYRPPAGNQVGLEFGAPYTQPAGNQVGLEFEQGEDHPVESQWLFPGGINDGEVVGPQVRLQFRHVLAQGAAHQAFGQPTVWNFTSRLSPWGVSPGAVGGHAIQNKHRTVQPTGFVAYQSGQANIINRNRYVAAGNIAPPTWGANPTVWLYTRYLKPGGLLATAIPDLHRVSHERQFVQLNTGIPAPGMGATWVSQGTRVVEPSGVFRDAVGHPQVGGTRYLEPSGWDSSAFGTRIIPESQTVAPQGFAELWGQQAIKNWLTFAEPSGFQTAGQEEYRWGRPDVWNLRQYVAQEYDPNSELNPPPWSQWTLIENRNRSIGAVGLAPPPAGFPQIDNNARPILPGGMVPPQIAGRTMIAYGRRYLPLEGVEPPLILSWHAVYNGARVLAPTGNAQSAFGVATLANTRRYFDRIGAIDSAEIGTAFIDFAIRGISIEPRYSIEPPDIKLPEVKLYTRYVEPASNDMLGIGLAALSIHFNTIGPKWALRDLFGEPRIYNVTPEVATYGANAEEFGAAFVRLQWRPVAPDGNNMQVFGQAKIADRKQTVTVPGTNMLKLGDKLVVTKTGAPPYSPQNIVVDQVVSSESMVGEPGLNQYVLYAYGITPPQMPSPFVRIMGVNIDAGIKVDDYGLPTVGLKNRVVTVAKWENDQVYQPEKPRLSPHTIWAVKEAPEQAKLNHPAGNLHYVGETLVYPPGERFGSARISTYLGILKTSTIGDASLFGVQNIYLKRRYLEPTGIQAYRMGWAIVGDGTQFVTQFGGTDSMRVGQPTIARGPYYGPQTIRPAGLPSPGPGVATWISLLNRTFQLTGFDSMRMGSSRGDSPYQWQTLHVGPPMPTIPAGFDAARLGTAWVSLRVRGVEPLGWESFLCEYDPAHFPDRMRVRNTYVPPGPLAQSLTPVGVDAPGVGVPNVRPGVHYIRPDGNADQYRKGAF